MNQHQTTGENLGDNPPNVPILTLADAIYVEYLRGYVSARKDLPALDPSPDQAVKLAAFALGEDCGARSNPPESKENVRTALLALGLSL